MSENEKEFSELDLDKADVVAFLAGDQAGFERLYARHYRPVVSFFRRAGFLYSECEDLAQEAFYRVYSNLGSYRGESRLGTWILEISSNVARNRLRSIRAQKRDGPTVSIDVVAPTGELTRRETPAPTPLSEALQRERVTILRDAVNTLPPSMRRCAELWIFADLRYREIAEMLGIGLNTVKSMLFEARKRLKPWLDQYFADAPPLLGEAPKSGISSTVISHNVTVPAAVQDGAPNLAGLTESFLVAEHAGSPHTFSAYRRHLQNFVRFLNGSAITPSTLKDYRTQLLRDGRGAASHKQALAAVRGLLSWIASTHEKAVSLPSLHTIQRILSGPGAVGEIPRTSVLTDEEAETLLTRAPTARDRAMLGLFLEGGLKVSELVSLRLENFKRVEPCLFVTVKERTLPLSLEVGTVIEAYLDETGRTWRSSGSLFLHLPRRGGRPSRSGMLSSRAVEYRLRQLLPVAGIKDKPISPESLRQTYAARFLQQDGDIETLRKLLGHVSLGTTERYLRHLHDLSPDMDLGRREPPRSG